MKNKKIKALSLLVVIIASFTLLFSGCGSQSSTAQGTSVQTTGAQQNAAAPTGSTTGAKIKVVVATGGMPKPFSYVDDNNQLEGYDIDLVRAVFKILPQYDMSIQKTEFTSIFAGLDSDRFQVGANNFAMNAERAQKYIYTRPTFKNQFVIAVKDGRTDIKSFADLAGKTTEAQTGVNYTIAMENYNKTHPGNPIKITYSQADETVLLQHVESGQTDFQLLDGPMLNIDIKEYGLKLKSILLSDEDSKLIGEPYSYLILSKGANSAQLEKDINDAIGKLEQDGTLTQISEKYFGADYSPKE